MKNIFFDFNGTLLDDMDISLKVFNKMLFDKGMELITTNQYLDVFGFPVFKYYQTVGFDFNQYSFEQLSIEFIDGYNQEVANCYLFHGVISLLEYLKARGYRLFVLSASEIGLLTRLLEHHQIAHYFEAILGLDNIHATSKIALAKEYMLKQQLKQEDTYLIGDTIHDYEVAQALHCHCLLVARGHQSKKRLLTCGVPVLDDIQEVIQYIV